MPPGYPTQRDKDDARESIDKVFAALSRPLRLATLRDFQRVRQFIAATPVTTRRRDPQL